MKTLRIELLALAVLLSLPVAGAAAEPFKVVANTAVREASVSRDALSRMFLKKTTRWSGGHEIRPVQPRSDALRAAFADRVHDMSLGALRSYWTQMIFSGRDVPPVEKGTDEQVIAYVREHPGAIGYVSSGADTGGVKLLELRP